MNRTERLTATLLLLQSGPHTAQQIAEHFGVARRTVLRDMDALGAMGVPLIARGGAGGGYALPPDYLLAPLPLTVREALLLLLALSSVEKLSDTPFAAERDSLIAKMRGLLPSRQREYAERWMERIALDVPRRGYKTPFIETLLQCAHAGRWVRVAYRSARGPSEQQVLPRRLYAEGGFWYCRAFSRERNEERVFRVDRFERVEPTDDASPPPAPDAARAYGHPAHPEVVVRMSAAGVLRAERDPHFGQTIQPEGSDGGGRLRFRCPPSELSWLARYLIGFGDDADVLAPDELRQRLRDLAQKTLARYADR